MITTDILELESFIDTNLINEVLRQNGYQSTIIELTEYVEKTPTKTEIRINHLKGQIETLKSELVMVTKEIGYRVSSRMEHRIGALQNLVQYAKDDRRYRYILKDDIHRTHMVLLTGKLIGWK